MIKEFNENISILGDLKNSITLDFIFTKINRTDKSFELKGSIEDIVPSRLSNLVKVMNDYRIDDNIKLKNKKKEIIYLKDYFFRDYLYFYLSHSLKGHENSIFKEQIYLAKLLLTDEKIKMDDLLKRFEFNREFDYEHKKRVNKEGVKEWIEFSNNFVSKENEIFNFFKKLNKIQEE